MTINLAKDDRPVLILDLDNCLADDEWRIKYIDWSAEDSTKRYEVYHMLGAYDAPDTEWLYHALYHLPLDRWPRADPSIMPTDCRVFIITGRNERFRTPTEDWLKAHLELPVEAILMRGNADTTPSAKLKADLLLSLIVSGVVRKSMVLLAADDHPDVLASYKALGIPGEVLHQHMIHSTCAYTMPVPAPPDRSPAPDRLSPADLLRAAALTFEARNAEYGGGYKTFGPVMAGLFPRGLTIETEDDWARLALVIMLAAKLSRYTSAFAEGGHQDSAHDMMPYAAMLEEMTK